MKGIVTENDKLTIIGNTDNLYNCQYIPPKAIGDTLLIHSPGKRISIVMTVIPGTGTG